MSEHQQDQLRFQEKKIKDQAETIEEQTKRIAEMMDQQGSNDRTS
tara:strand:- start:410 stop:544 length:135 start_codon:yes stop_codon:yes gene_type:complete